VKLWRGLPIAEHSPERIIINRFALLPTKMSNGDIVWLETVRWTLDRGIFDQSSWVCVRRERIKG
jgi:hypothetical protein